MGWTELRERNSGEGMERVKMLLKETKENLEEICDTISEMDGHSYGERGMYSNRDNKYMHHRDEDYGERDSWRIERERRGRM